MRVAFLFYEETWREPALQLVATKPKAAHMVEGNLAEGLAAINLDDGNRSNGTAWKSRRLSLCLVLSHLGQ